MELKLINGKYVCDKRGLLEAADNTDEILQRILTKLQTKQGSFLPLPIFGSRLYTLPTVKPSERETAARQFISEALAGETEITLDTMQLKMLSENEVQIEMVFDYKGTEKLRVTAVT